MIIGKFSVYLVRYKRSALSLEFDECFVTFVANLRLYSTIERYPF